MLRDVRRPTNYRAPINLYVEDRLTEAYLSELWSDSSIGFFLGGGNEGVEAIARTEQAAGYKNVFGLIDRDYRPSNRDEWLSPDKTFPVFILPVHEIENYLLDADAMISSRYHNRNLSRKTVEDFFTTRAERLCEWAACREVVAELKKRFRGEFIQDPPLKDDGDWAYDHICNAPWFKKLPHEAARSSAEDIRNLLSAARSQASARLQDGSWRNDFAGKEIFNDATSRICDRPTLDHPPPKSAEFIVDLAKDVAVWQKDNQKVPQDLAELREALKQRIARPRQNVVN